MTLPLTRCPWTGVGISTGALRAITLAFMLAGSTVVAAQTLPIADVHVHYSHDSVELTPPSRVIELMREANLKFALVSSSDDRGTQKLLELAPDLIIPGLRPYSRRGQTGTWFTNDDSLAYVEELLRNNRYASLGEFHLYGDDADLEIPRRIVQLADEHNLVLHAHSDAEAIERLLAQSDTIRIIWAHSGFDDPADIANLLRKHDRLMADLAFRSDVGSSGSLEEEWISLFTEFPDRMMLGTDTYTPERIHFIPEHASTAREWLADLPDELAERIAWKNAYEMLMPVWKTNVAAATVSNSTLVEADDSVCSQTPEPEEMILNGEDIQVRMRTTSPLVVSQPVSLLVSVCGTHAPDIEMKLDARMPAHGHGTNYVPELSVIDRNDRGKIYAVEGVVLHMPGDWQWTIELTSTDRKQTLTQEFVVE